MMLLRPLFRRLTACLLVLALPLQGIAASVPAASCGDEHAMAAASVEHHAAEHHHAAPHDPAAAEHEHQAAAHNHGGDSGQPENAGHSCCHHVFTGVAVSLIPLAPEAPSAITPRVSLLNTLFIPELPQRPPRA